MKPTQLDMRLSELTFSGNKRTDMQLDKAIKKAREAKGLSQKQASIACKMDQAYYSRIENGKIDPSFSVVVRIAKALKVDLLDLLRAEETFKEVQSIDKSLLERVAYIDSLDKKDRTAILAVLDAMITKKRLKDSFQEVIAREG